MIATLSRPMLAGTFLYRGLEAVRSPERIAAQAEPVVSAVAKPLGISADTTTLVRVNGSVQVVGGLLMATGKLPRLAAITLAASVIPTTFADHRFWEETDKQHRNQQAVLFLQDVSLFGGLIMAASDRGGRPSLGWRAKRAGRKAARETTEVSRKARALVRS